MEKKLCIGANPSVVLDFMRAGKCVSVSKTCIPWRFIYFLQCWFAFKGGWNRGLGRWGILDHSLSFTVAFLACVRREALTVSLCPMKNLQMNVTWGESRCCRKMIQGWMLWCSLQSFNKCLFGNWSGSHWTWVTEENRDITFLQQLNRVPSQLLRGQHVLSWYIGWYAY